MIKKILIPLLLVLLLSGCSFKNTEETPVQETNESNFKDMISFEVNTDFETRTTKLEYTFAEYFSSLTMTQLAETCGKEKDTQYFSALRTPAKANSVYVYKIDSIDPETTNTRFSIMVTPNSFGYETMEDFKEDFDNCTPNGRAPYKVTPEWLIFESRCGIEYDYLRETGKIDACRAIQSSVVETLEQI